MAYTVEYGVPSQQMNVTTAQDGKIVFYLMIIIIIIIMIIIVIMTIILFLSLMVT